MNLGRTSARLFLPPNYAHSVQVDAASLIFTAGGVPLDADGKLVGRDDLVAQTERVVDNLRIVLADELLTFDDVVKTTVYVCSSLSDDLAKVWHTAERTGLARPTIASTLIGVSVLGYPGQLVEIELIAAVGE